MKRTPKNRNGFTLAEMLVTIAVFSIVGMIFFDLLSLNLSMSSKNAAINVSHEQARMAMDRMSKDIGAAISVPILTDTSFNQVANPYALCAGVSFLKMASPMLEAGTQSSGTGQNQFKILAGTFVPQAGEWLVVPAYQIQQSIASVSAPAGGVTTLTLTANLSATVSISGTTNVVALVADQVGYAVINNELRYFPQTDSLGKYSVVARGVISPTPFTVPPN